MSKFKWSRYMIEALVHQYKMHPNLYDMRHPDYIHRKKRERSYDEIYMALKKLDSYVNLPYIRMKIKTLRTQYVKELRRAQQCEISQEVHQTNFWCYDQLKFLEKHCIIRKPVGSDGSKLEANSFPDHCETNDSMENDTPAPAPKKQKLMKNSFEDYEDHEENYDSYETEVPSPRSKKIKDSYETEVPSPRSQKKSYAIQKIRKQILDTTKLFQAELDQKYDWLGKQVVFEINKIQNEELQEHTAWDIQQILRESIQRDRQLRDTEESSNPPSSSEVCSWMMDIKESDPLDK